MKKPLALTTMTDSGFFNCSFAVLATNGNGVVFFLAKTATVFLKIVVLICPPRQVIAP